MRWYVYVYYDEDHQPFYCGKGCGNRAFTRHDVPVPPRERMVFRYFDEEEQAFQLEKDLISFWGRRDYEHNGVLMNKSLGGPGTPGFKHSEKSRKKHSLSKTGKKNPNYGRTGAKHPMFGKKHTAEAIAKIAARSKGERNPSTREWVVNTPEGETIFIKCLKPFCLQHNLTPSAMYRVAMGDRKHHKGWTCRYA